ncbi:nitrate reductase associated protein [Pedobacter hartonius]|nr:nitrate reductase associated protein [Pedobacter hartonius]
MRKVNPGPSEFINLQGIEYFKFEEDFMEENVRCIPMAVRFKLDAAGIKLKLADWSRFHPSERIKLALLPARTSAETKNYHLFLTGLIKKHTGKQPTLLPVESRPGWLNRQQIPAMLKEKSEELQLDISVEQWSSLSNIQRFALLKLCRPGHENENFPKAAEEFGLLSYHHGQHHHH